MHEQDFTAVVKKLVPLVNEIRDTISSKNGLDIKIMPDGEFVASLYEPLNDGYYNSLQATYRPPTKEVIEVNAVNY